MQWLVRAEAWVQVLTLSYCEQVAKLSGVGLGRWWLKALNLTQQQVAVS